MTTDKRTLTSPANGAKSKGPKSIAGKANSARNATRYGLVAQNLVLNRESAARFAGILAEMHSRFRPLKSCRSRRSR